MLVVVALFALWLGYYTHWIRQRREGLIWLEKHDFPEWRSIELIRTPRPDLPWPLRLLGERPASSRLVQALEEDRRDLPAYLARRDEIRRLFPECVIQNVEGDTEPW
ncbi:MAG TPA: hypothetical protein VGJ26_11070 [Pirellulales bacterium]|jgi:hypothetical protein